MKKYHLTFSIFTLLYITASFIYLPLLRVRYLLVFFVLVCLMYLSDWALAAYFLGTCAVIALFFFKIIPSPYPQFTKMGLPMGISILATVVTIGIAVMICVFVVKGVTMIATKRSSKQN